MGKGDDTVYQSPHYKSTDDIGFQTLLGALTGQGITSSPQMNSNLVAEQLGGKYNSDTGIIKMPDGSSIKFDPLSNTFVDSSGQGPVGRGETEYNSHGKPNSYVEAANNSLEGINKNVYGNPNSAMNLFSQNNKQNYDPKTGQYSSEPGSENNDLSADHYLQEYGQYLDTPYSKSDPYKTSGYNEFDYKSPTIGSVDNISDAARADIYQKGADRISSSYRDEQQHLDDFISRNNSNLSSGRAAKEQSNIDENRTRELTELERGTETDHQMRKFNDASHVRDMQANQDQDVQKLQGDENRAGQLFDQSEKQYGYDTGNKENQFAFNAGQKQGQDKIGIAEGINTNNRNQAYQELQGNRQENANKMTWLDDMLRIYAGQDSTAAQLQAAQSQAIGSTLGGLFGAAGSVATAGIKH